MSTPVDLKPKNNYTSAASANAEAPRQQGAPRADASTLKSVSRETDDSFDCLACVKHYASMAFNGICSLCSFIYNLLFGNKVTPEKKAEEAPKAPEVKEQPKAEEKPESRATDMPRTAPATAPAEQPEAPPAKPVDNSSTGQFYQDRFQQDKELTLQGLREAGYHAAPGAVRNFISMILIMPGATQSYIDKTNLSNLHTLADQAKRKVEGAMDELIKAIEKLPSPSEFAATDTTA